MEASDRESALSSDLAPLLRELGFTIVELRVATVKGRAHVDIVIYGTNGTSIEECVSVHKVAMSRAELILNDRDVAVQIASPGIDRTFKSNSEFALFIDRGVTVLLRGTKDWTGGVVESVSAGGVVLRSGRNHKSVAFADVRKARLDYSQEVRQNHGR